MNLIERAFTFLCGNEHLVAVVSEPSQPLKGGVLVVVGGPQYRVGSHRQFTLMCRELAAQGVATMRFDFRGMGDSDGAMRDFQRVAPDICAAVDAFCAAVPGLRQVVLWGLCDGASASLMYAHCDERVHGLVLLNPWVRTPEGLAKVQIRHYYWSRLSDYSFWSKVASGRFPVIDSVRSFSNALLVATGIRQVATDKADAAVVGDAASHVVSAQHVSLPDRMADGLSRFRGKVLLILSGNDLTAQEFEGIAEGSKRWRGLLADARITHRKLDGANHTFSKRVWRDQVAAWTVEWIRGS